MRFTLFTLLLMAAIRGESLRYLEMGDILECLLEMDAECVAEALRRGRPGKLMPRRGVPPGKDVTLKKIAGSDLMDSYGSVPDRFPFREDDGKFSEGGDHTDKIVIPLILGFKVLSLIAAAAVKHFFVKAAILAKISLIISVWLVHRVMSRSSQGYKDLLPASPSQYPVNEPDLSGYGYTGVGGYKYNEEDLVLAALNKTLMSRPGKKKWRIVLSDS